MQTQDCTGEMVGVAEAGGGLGRTDHGHPPAAGVGDREIPLESKAHPSGWR